MTPNDYQQLAMRTEPSEEHYDAIVLELWQKRLMHGVIGADTEAGELADQLKKNLFYGRPIDSTNVKEECGDLLWYISIALDAVDCTMGRSDGGEHRQAPKAVP